MKLTIQGQDYTSALDSVQPLVIERRLNEPSTCRFLLSIGKSGALEVPRRGNSIAIAKDDGRAYFTGYVAVNPVMEYAGLGIEGPRYRFAIEGVSDEILLDQLPIGTRIGSVGASAGALISTLVTHSGSAALSTRDLTLGAPVSSFVQDSSAPWSKSAGQIANSARAAYRALSGALTLTPLQTTVHSLDEDDGSLTLANLNFTNNMKRSLANDITVCGEHEPTAYVTEYFLGDGVTTQFYLSADPYFPAASKTAIIHELFNEPAVDERAWGRTGGPTCLGLGANGLAMSGGNGLDGQTVLSWLDPVEMGGTLLLEATGIILSPASTGVLAGFFSGGFESACCTAGFRVTAEQGTGEVSIQPLIQGTPTGDSFAINSANQYTVRLRVHCPECIRGSQVYRSFGDNGALSAGGDWKLSPGKVQFDVQEYVNGVGAMPVTLYEGAISNVPGSCAVVASSSLNLMGSMRSLNLANLGSGWVVSTPPNGGSYTRRVGSTAEGGECHLERTGLLVFYAGYVPVVGEQIAVTYRTLGRAVGRAVNSASQRALAEEGLPAVAAWTGSVTEPPARSSADCRNAALVLAQAAAEVAAAWSGTFKGSDNDFTDDVWPGDALQLNVPSADVDAQTVVRAVKISYRATCPDLVEYAITFANDWADDLAIKTSATVPADAWLPAPVAPTLLANLSPVSVSSLTGDTVSINIGLTPPTGGGFEIRRRDFAFMPGTDPCLVIRSSLPNITFSRETANDRFFIRMYDDSIPPNYSEFSTALFINLPLGV